MRTLLVALFLGLFIFMSCSETSRAGKVSVADSLQLTLELTRAFDPVLGVWVVDDRLIVPNESDVKKLIKFYNKRKEFTGFVREGWDCDDFAREFKHYSAVWARKFYGSLPAGLTVGIAWVHLDGDCSDLFPGQHTLKNELHATILIIREDQKIFWYEPQTDTLTRIESSQFEGTINILRLEF